MPTCWKCSGYSEGGKCPACQRQDRYLDEVNSQRIESLKEQRILQQQLIEQEKEVVAAQKAVADEIQETRETDTFFKQREYAEKGDCIAQDYIGWAFENGVGTEKDIDAAMSWWRKAVKNGSAKAGGKLEWYTKLELADGGNSDAQFYIGSRSKSPQKEKYLRQAAEQGHPAAQLLLAQMLSSNLHEQRYGLDDTSRLIHDADESIDWYKKYKSSHEDYNIAENINKIEANLADILLKNIKKANENIADAKFGMLKKNLILLGVFLAFWLIGLGDYFLIISLICFVLNLLKISSFYIFEFFCPPGLEERLSKLENAYALRYPNLLEPSSLPSVAELSVADDLIAFIKTMPKPSFNFKKWGKWGKGG